MNNKKEKCAQIPPAAPAECIECIPQKMPFTGRFNQPALRHDLPSESEPAPGLEKKRFKHAFCVCAH